MVPLPDWLIDHFVLVLRGFGLLGFLWLFYLLLVHSCNRFIENDVWADVVNYSYVHDNVNSGLFLSWRSSHGNEQMITPNWAHRLFVKVYTNEPMNDSEKTILIHRLCVSVALSTFWWWRHNPLSDTYGTQAHLKSDIQLARYHFIIH